MAFEWLSDAADWTGDQFGLGGRPEYQNQNRVGVDDAVQQGNYQWGDLGGRAAGMQQLGGQQGRTAPQHDAARMRAYHYGADQAGTAQRSLAGQQQGYIGQLQRVADGTAGPSAAELGMQRASTDAAQQQLMQAAAAGGGPGGVAAAIRAQNQNAQAQGSLQRDLGVQRAAEQATARQMLGGAMNDARGQELSAAGLYTGLGANMAQSNQQAQLQMAGMDDSMRQFYFGQGNQLAVAENQAGQAYGNARADYLGGLESADASRYGVREGAQGQRFGATANMVGSGFEAMTNPTSDVRAKTDIRPAEGQLAEGFRKIGAYGYEYRRPELHGEGPQVGVMAQDLARDPTLSAAVQKGPDGMLRVDGGRLSTMTAAEVAQQRREIDELKAASQPQTGGQRAAGTLASAFGAFGAHMTGGRNSAADAISARDARRQEAAAELADLEERNRRDAEMLARLDRAGTEQTAAIRSPRVAYPTPQAPAFGYDAAPPASRAPNSFGFGASPVAYAPAPSPYGY